MTTRATMTRLQALSELYFLASDHTANDTDRALYFQRIRACDHTEVMRHLWHLAGTILARWAQVRARQARSLVAVKAWRR